MIRYTSKGQALVEFVIILPIFIFMLFATIDFGKVLYIENDLESRMDDVITLYRTTPNLEKIKNDLNLNKDKITLTLTKDKEYLNITLEKEVEIITPGLNVILKNPHQTRVKRVILNE